VAIVYRMAPPAERTADPETAVPEADGRTTRWVDHKVKRKDRVLEAAIAAIAAEGSDVGVQQIAARADVPRSAVYRIFADRGDLDEQIRARIIDRLMADLAPALTPQGTVEQAITRAVDTYLHWIVQSPRLHQFLGTGSAKRRIVGSRVVTGTRTAIAVQLTKVLETVLRELDRDTGLAESVAFGLVGLVDASVNRWLNSPRRMLTAEQLAGFLTTSIWQVLDGNLRDLGVIIDPTTPLSALRADP